MDNKLAIKKEETQVASSLGVFSSMQKFEEAARMSKALATSTLVPKEYQNNISNCMIAIDTAQRLNISPFATMQNLYIVNGRPSWSSQFIISAINKCHRFSEPLKFKLEGEGNGLKCYAYTKDLNGNELKGPLITMEMARIEGWLNKNGSKWKTMPQVMIQYRAASFFGRLHCPDILMGVYTDDENVEREPATVIDISVEDSVNKEIEEKGNSKAIDIEEKREGTDDSNESHKKEESPSKNSQQTKKQEDGPAF